MNKIKLLMFGADWCPPCRRAKAYIEQKHSDMLDHYEWINVDTATDEQKSLILEYQIKSIPFFVLQEGDEYKSMGGMQMPNIDAIFQLIKEDKNSEEEE